MADEFEFILADASAGKRFVKLAGVLAPDAPPSEHDDPIADALHEFRQERTRRLMAPGAWRMARGA
ncbi:MAG: hypothetical protein GY859_34765 [Desulfobacterales bacterium]|nr:hypothetical protein [Desulfobacterales bacterium]